MTTRLASCHCGRLRLACDGEPKMVSLCHCSECQRRTGSTYSIAAFYDRAHVREESGTSLTFERGSASGQPVKFHFCGTCGSNIYWEPARMPSLIGVAVGAFADPDFPMPQQSVWTKDKHAWVNLPEAVIQYEVTRPR